MFEFEKFWPVLQAAGVPERAKKWAARAVIVCMLVSAGIWAYGAYNNRPNLFQKTPIDSTDAPLPEPQQAAEHPPKETPHKQHTPKLRSISPTCALVSRIAQDYNFEDGTHQMAAWQALENLVSQLPPQERASVNLELVQAARNDWNGGAPSDALSKFVSAFKCP